MSLFSLEKASPILSMQELSENKAKEHQERVPRAREEYYLRLSSQESRPEYSIYSRSLFIRFILFIATLKDFIFRILIRTPRI